MSNNPRTCPRLLTQLTEACENAKTQTWPNSGHRLTRGFGSEGTLRVDAPTWQLFARGLTLRDEQTPWPRETYEAVFTQVFTLLPVH